jgi:hypothetical protein
MSLANYKRKTRAYSVGGQTLNIGGLSVSVISELVAKHLTQVDELMERFAGENQNVFAPNAGDKLILSLVKDAPQITSFLIANACGEPEAEEQASQIPFSAQVEMLTIVGEMTFEDAGGPKKLFETLRRLRGPTTPAKVKGKTK